MQVLGRLVYKEGVRVLSLCLWTGIFVLSRLPDGSFLASHWSAIMWQLSRVSLCKHCKWKHEDCHYSKWQERSIIQLLAYRKQCHSKAPRDELRARVAYCLAVPFWEAWVRWMLYCFWLGASPVLQVFSVSSQIWPLCSHPQGDPDWVPINQPRQGKEEQANGHGSVCLNPQPQQFLHQLRQLGGIVCWG